MGGFIRDDGDNDRNVVGDVEITLPLESNVSCSVCYSLLIDVELRDVFGLLYCKNCKYNIKFITKTDCINLYLLSDSDISGLKYLSRSNPHRGTWNSMKLYLKSDVLILAEKKYGSLDEIEKIKEERKQRNISRKIRKLKENVKKIRKATKIKVVDRKKHEHNFTNVDGKIICKCGMVVDQEEF